LTAALLTASAPTVAALLVELFTEELPPRALARLGDAFADGIAAGLRQRGLAPADAAVERFASPRRLAVRIGDVLSQAPPQAFEARGPSVKVALDANGMPTQALIKWAERTGAPLDRLERASDGKQDCFWYRGHSPGAILEGVITQIIEAALEALPVPRLMHYQLGDGHTTVRFVRPAHGLVVLHGDRIVPASVLGLQSGRTTFGHRFQSAGAIELAHADDYESTLLDKGRVIASHTARRERIEAGLKSRAAQLDASIGEGEAVSALIDEVAALVEWPAVYVGGFEPAFLEVPPECLILTMRTNQKYFPLFDAGGRLLPTFLLVSNMEVDDPALIVDGNQRVVRPRLADARFFFEQDRKASLESRLPRLESVVYHAKLGSQARRIARVRQIAATVAGMIGADATLVDRAALLAKADLLTGMVGEFPELQGIMGAHYARHDAEPDAVAIAIREHYQPRFAGDALPSHPVSLALALADKLETLAGLFSIGQLPTGDKDPFALRRHALGVIRMLIECRLGVTITGLLDCAFAAFNPVADETRRALADFIFERLSGWCRERGFTAQEVAAVIDLRPGKLLEVPQRLEAVRVFTALPEAIALAAANKRIANILRKAVDAGEQAPASPPADTLFTEAAERDLGEVVNALSPQVDSAMQRGDYTGAMTLMARARDPVDRFFDTVMVMTDDPAVRANRLALLDRLRGLMNRVADISRLSA
jgi:glycyl-tRNA synthetase beta chain